MRLIGFAMLFVAVVVTLWQVVWLGGSLPDPVASHFDAGGNPDGTMSRSGFLAMHCGLQIAMAAMMLGIAYGMKWMPDSLINLPHKEYWLHEDRRKQTLSENASMMVFIAGITALFLACVFQLVYAANIQMAAKLPTAWMGICLGVYLVVIIGMVVRMSLRFRLPAEIQSGKEGVN